MGFLKIEIVFFMVTILIAGMLFEQFLIHTVMYQVERSQQQAEWLVNF